MRRRVPALIVAGLLTSGAAATAVVAGAPGMFHGAQPAAHTAMLYDGPTMYFGGQPAHTAMFHGAPPATT